MMIIVVILETVFHKSTYFFVSLRTNTIGGAAGAQDTVAENIPFVPELFNYNVGKS